MAAIKNLGRILKLFRHWAWMVPLAESVIRKEAEVAGLKPGQIATLAVTRAELFGETLTIYLSARRKS